MLVFPLKQQEPSEKFRFVISLIQDSSPTTFREGGGGSIHVGEFPHIAKCLLGAQRDREGQHYAVTALSHEPCSSFSDILTEKITQNYWTAQRL